jgi:signal peptidase II
MLVEASGDRTVAIGTLSGDGTIAEIPLELYVARVLAGGGDSASVLLALLGLGALTAVAVYFWLAPPGHRLLMTSLALIIGGAVGNLVDRVVSGAVTDFLDFYVGTHHWPSFNVADSAISIGIALMALDAFRTPHRERESAPEIPAATSP